MPVRGSAGGNSSERMPAASEISAGGCAGCAGAGAAGATMMTGGWVTMLTSDGGGLRGGVGGLGGVGLTVPVSSSLTKMQVTTWPG